MKLLMIVLPALGAGFVQGVTGFGFGVIVVMFYLALIGIVPAACVSQSLSAFLCLAMVVRYRKHIRWKLLVLPLVFYFPLYFGVITVVAGVDMEDFKWALGLFLMGLSLYFLKFSQKIRIRPGLKNVFICTALAALIDGTFGIGGPSMVVYFLAVTEEKEEYLGTIQAFFLFVCICGTCMRIARGMMGPWMLPVLVPGFLAMMAGVLCAAKAVRYLDREKMRLMIYGLIGCVGAYTFAAGII